MGASWGWPRGNKPLPHRHILLHPPKEELESDAPTPGSPGRRRQCSSRWMRRRHHPRPGPPPRTSTLQTRASGGGPSWGSGAGSGTLELTCAAGAAAPRRGGQWGGAGLRAAGGLAHHLSPLPGRAVAQHRVTLVGLGRGGDEGGLTWQLQLWHPSSAQLAPGSRGTPRYQQPWADGGEVPGGPTARGDGSVARDTEMGEEKGSWVPGAAAGRWGEEPPRRGPPEPGGSRTRVGGCCRDCRMGDGARMDLGYPRGAKADG